MIPLGFKGTFVEGFEDFFSVRNTYGYITLVVPDVGNGPREHRRRKPGIHGR